MIHISWPQGIYLAIALLGVCVAASKNSQPRTGNHDLGAAILAQTVVLGLLYWGGFFS